MKIQCSCGVKYEFELTPDMKRGPVKFVCPACGLDSSEFVDGLVRKELGQAVAPSGQSVSIPAEAPQSATELRDSRSEAPKPGSLRIAGTRAEQPRSPGAEEPGAVVQPMSGAAVCPRHPAELVVETCQVCGKPICAKCMELFGYVCSPLC